MCLQSKEFAYALVRVDIRGIGKSQGTLDVFGLQRSQDINNDAEGQGTARVGSPHKFVIILILARSV